MSQAKNTIPLLGAGPSPVTYSSITWEYLRRSPQIIGIRLLRTLATTTIFTMAVLKYPKLLPSIGPVSIVSSAISGIISAPAYGTTIITSIENGRKTKKAKEEFEKIHVSSLKMITKFGAAGSLVALAAGSSLFFINNDDIKDFGIFFLGTAFFPLLSAWYNSTAQYLQGLKKENTVLLINLIGTALTSALCWGLTFPLGLGMWACALSFLARSALNFLFTLPFNASALKNMFFLDTNNWEKKQWNKSKFMTLHFATEFLLPTSISIIMRILGEVSSSAYTLFSFYKLLVSFFMYGLTSTTRLITSDYARKYPENLSIQKKASFKIGVVGAVLQLLFTGSALAISIFYGRNFLNLLTKFHGGESQAAVDKAVDIMPLFTGLMMVDSLRLVGSSVFNGRKNTKTPALQSLCWIGVLAQAAVWTAGAGLGCSMEMLAYISYAAFGLNALTLGMGLKSELSEEKPTEKQSLFDKACNFMKSPSLPELRDNHCCRPSTALQP